MSTFDDLLAQRNAAIDALIAIKQDLQSNGECYVTDEARIARIDCGLKDAGTDPTESD